MTGYGYQEQQDQEAFLSVEIKGYNSRFLEMTVNLPPQISGLDHEIRRYMADRCRRGKIEVNLRLREYDTAFSVSLNRGAVNAYLAAIAGLRKTILETDFSFLKKNSLKKDFLKEEKDYPPKTPQTEEDFLEKYQKEEAEMLEKLFSEKDSSSLKKPFLKDEETQALEKLFPEKKSFFKDEETHAALFEKKSFSEDEETQASEEEYHALLSGLEEEEKEFALQNLGLILGLEGILEIEKNGNKGAYWGRIEPVLRSAADQFEAYRVREGKHTEEAIFSHLSVIESAAEVIAENIPVLEGTIKENLKTRFLELQKDLDENRVLAETAVLLMKYSIAEEVSRISAHLKEFRAEADRNPSPGKKLDFLCQELNREINTIGSKTPVLEVSRAVVAMKDALENIREQLRNIE
ncbi:MAG: DUF1732 domain-containing protein [Spirochaetaceae bacterium]|jgi:uncharacterized protein (TIGR00255 family)|nr:DUF1732 domain-containing protein [Spirochaetaceae bacterium]